jgi:hypothetical protein
LNLSLGTYKNLVIRIGLGFLIEYKVGWCGNSRNIKDYLNTIKTELRSDKHSFLRFGFIERKGQRLSRSGLANLE